MWVVGFISWHRVCGVYQRGALPVQEILESKRFYETQTCKLYITESIQHNIPNGSIKNIRTAKPFVIITVWWWFVRASFLRWWASTLTETALGQQVQTGCKTPESCACQDESAGAKNCAWLAWELHKHLLPTIGDQRLIHSLDTFLFARISWCILVGFSKSTLLRPMKHRLHGQLLLVK